MTLTLIFGGASLAANSDYFVAVLQSEAGQKVTAEMTRARYDLHKIEQTQTFRCPGCYEFTLSFRGREAGEQVAKLMTELNFEDQTIRVRGQQ